MKVGFDLDGVLVDFSSAYQQLFVALTGEDKFLPGDAEGPPTWDWPKLRGYTPLSVRTVWNHINSSHDFWRMLPRIEKNVSILYDHIHKLNRKHELYFATNRTGIMVKDQTEQWLRVHIADGLTVLIVAPQTKGLVARALQLDCYVDDNYDNCIDCVRESPITRTYLVNRRYNRAPVTGTVELIESRRIAGVGEFLRRENLVD